MTVRVRQIDDTDQMSWDAFVASANGASFYHEYAWRPFYQQYFRKETFYFAAFDGDSIVGVSPLVRQRSRLFGDYLVSMPFFNYGGILADNTDVEAMLVAAIRRLADETGVSHVELRGLSAAGSLPTKTNKVAMRLALPPTFDELGKSLGSKLRSQIRRPQRENPEVHAGGIELLDDFYAVFSRNMRDLGTPVYAQRMFAEIIERFPNAAEIVLVRIGGEPAAAGFLLHNSGMTEVPWASSDRRYNKISVNMLLYSEMLKQSIERRSLVFDFGRSSKDSGTYRFKKQWGAEPVQLHWSYVLREGGDLPELNPENTKYSLAIRAWQKLPLVIANSIGPFLARQLP